MDNIPCGVAQDLMPLAAEGMAAPDSEKLLSAHVANCPACKQVWETMAVKPQEEAAEQAPLLSLKKALRRRTWHRAFLAVAAALLLLSALGARWTQRTYLPFERSGLVMTPSSDGSVLFLSFADAAVEYQLNIYHAGEAYQERGGGNSTDIRVYTSTWSNWMKSRMPRTTVIPQDYQLWYLSGDGQEDQLIWSGAKAAEPLEGGRYTLPRLALTYYLQYAGLALAVAGVLWLVFRRKRLWGTVFFAIAAYALSYGIGHLIVMGATTISYQITRDFVWICLIALLLGTLLIGLRDMLMKKESPY